MTPIDQIRKALANVADALKTAQRGVVYAHENAASKHLEAEYEAVLNTIADATAQLAEARSSMAALLASHAAAVQRAAEMQEDARDVEIPEGWAFYAADFSINADDFSKPGWVMLRRTGRNYAAWHALDEETQDATALFTKGQGFDYAAALKQAIRAIPMDPIRAIKE